METGTSFHILGDDIKFEAREYARLIQNQNEFEFQNDYYYLTLCLEKKPNALWGEITGRSYGGKRIRFTQRANGETGIWFVLRLSQQTVIEKAKIEGSIWRRVTVDNLTYSFSITLKPSIVPQIKKRGNNRTKQITEKKRHEKALEKEPVEYTCYNPKPYQAGSFSPK